MRHTSAGFHRSPSLIAAIVFALLLALHPSNAATAGTLLFHASASGKLTLDQGEGGGNPFASALVDILARPAVGLAELAASLAELTARKSSNFQQVDGPRIEADGGYRIVPPAKGERRIALVMVVADYELSGAASLPGARNDGGRVAAALRAAGFDTELALDLSLPRMRERLQAFRTRSEAYDMAAVYVTGHGVEVHGRVHLLAGDYPVVSGNAALAARALPLTEIVAAPAARRLNLVFYGGCRDNPFAE